nr:AraC family transcriptional regulator [Sphingobium sp. Sx8-8]
MTESQDFQETVKAGKQLSDFAVSVSDFRWNARFSTRYSPTRHLLVTRLHPYQVEMFGALGGESSFSRLGPLIYFPADVEIATLETPTQGKSHNIVFAFSNNWLERHGFSSINNLGESRQCLDLTSACLTMYLHRTGSELLNPGMASDFLLNSLAEALTVELLNHVNRSTRDKRVRSTGGRLDTAGLHRVLEMVAHDPGCRLSDLAAELGWSAGHLGKAFRNTTGISLHKHIAQVRIGWAQELLKAETPIKQVAYRLGFSGVSAFSRAYFNETGHRPSDWRDGAAPSAMH